MWTCSIAVVNVVPFSINLRADRAFYWLSSIHFIGVILAMTRADRVISCFLLSHDSPSIKSRRVGNWWSAARSCFNYDRSWFVFFSTSLGIALIPRLRSNVETDVKRSNYVGRYLKYGFIYWRWTFILSNEWWWWFGCDYRLHRVQKIAPI